MKPTSTDPKPSCLPHGTIIQEDDTKDYYQFDANRNMWVEIGFDTDIISVMEGNFYHG